MASVRTDGKGQIQRAPQQNGPQAPNLVGFIEKHSREFALVMPKHLNADRMTRLAISAVRTTRHLGDCSLPSFASAIMACSVLGLEPNTPLGHAYLIPFKNNQKGIYECQLIIGYKGLVDLMYRSGIVASVQCTPVFEGDEFDYEYGLHPDIKHRASRAPGRWNPAKLTHVYPVVKLREQGVDPIWDVLDKSQIDARRRRSKASGSGPWVTDFVAMAKKTGVRSIATWVPSSTERPDSAALAFESSQERGRAQEAVGALGEKAQETLLQLGVFPTEDDEDAASSADVAEDFDKETGEVLSPPAEAPTREMGED